MRTPTRLAAPDDSNVSQAAIYRNEANVKLYEADNKILAVDAAISARRIAYDKAFQKLTDDFNTDTAELNAQRDDWMKVRKLALGAIEAAGPVEEPTPPTAAD